MAKLKDSLFLSGKTALDVMLGSTETETTAEMFKRIQTVIVGELEMPMKNQVRKLNIDEVFESCETTEALEAAYDKMEFVSLETKEILADKLEVFSISDAAKFYLFGLFLDAYYVRVKDNIDGKFRKKHMEIINGTSGKKANSKKGRIITDL